MKTVCGNTPRSRHLTFLVRWPSRQAMGHARQRIREITARSRLRVPVEIIVRDLNRFLRGWAGYFRYGNSAQFFDKITLHALRRLAGFIAQRHKRRKRYGWWVVAHQTHRMGLINLNGTIIAPRPTPRRRGTCMPAVKNVGELCAGKPHARIEAAAGGNQRQSATPRRAGASRRPDRDPISGGSPGFGLARYFR